MKESKKRTDIEELIKPEIIKTTKGERYVLFHYMYDFHKLVAFVFDKKTGEVKRYIFDKARRKQWTLLQLKKEIEGNCRHSKL
jgi:hypothetical protein